MSYTVTVGAGSATIALTKGAGVSIAAIDTLINGTTYQNTNTDNPTAGDRTFTLTQIQDSGGTANGGVDTATVSIAAPGHALPGNDPPTMSNVAPNDAFTQEQTLTLSPRPPTPDP